MPVVTAIKQKQRQGSALFQVSIDGTFAFTLSDLDLSASGIRVGKELTADEISEYTNQATGAKAYALALRLIEARLRSRREIHDYLRRKEFEPAEIEPVLERLEELDLLDDEKFARAWVSDRLKFRVRSRLRLQQELAAKGIPRDIADRVLEDLEPEDELAALIDLIERKQRQSAYQDTKKLTGYLQRQGYKWSLIQSAFERMGDAS